MLVRFQLFVSTRNKQKAFFVWDFGRVMRGRKWHWNLVSLVLFLSVAVAQKDNLRNDVAKPGDAGANHKSGPGTEAPVNSAKSDRPVVNGSGQSSDQTSGQMATQSGTSSTPAMQGQAPAAAPFVEDFPTRSGEDIPHSHGKLPVIVNSDYPQLDRSVRREDLQPVPPDYVIGDEDVITITIWKEKELSGTVVVRPDGKLTVPLVGEMKVVGLKPLELQSLLEEKLKPFITVPQVSVAVNQINSRKIYLIGQVMREGTFPINSSMTVLQVLAAAGGLRDFAKKKKIYVLRKQGDQEIRFPFDYDAAIHGRNREENILLEPGDTIVVP
jgi:polysaccharide biosynthesis/export protein